MNARIINGVAVELPEGFSVVPQTDAPRTRSGPYPALGVDPLISALKRQEIEVTATVPISATPLAPPSKRGAVVPPPASLEVSLGADQEAMVLVEKDGFYQWHLPEETVVHSQPVKRGPGVVPRAR